MSAVLPAAADATGRDCAPLTTPPPPSPPTEAEFAAAMAAFGPFERRPGIAVGVSGGPDSMALALLVQRWVAVREGRLLAFVVDHRLRPESAVEADSVVARLAALGIEARLLTRTGPMPATALQATARQARYALLETATAAAGFLHLAIAHHRQDQAETVALRRSAGSGTRGLAGMAAVRELDHVRLLRPLLGIAPERLKALLVARGVIWLDDPANSDPRFWRARYRAAAPGLTARTVAGQAAAEAHRLALDPRVAAWLAGFVRPHPLGFVSLPATALAETDHELRLALLARLLVATAGAVWPPGCRKLERLAGWLEAGCGRRLAVGGVLVERGAAGTLRFVREPRATAGAAVLPSAGLRWDGRFVVGWPGMSGRIEVAKAGPGWRQRLATGAPGIDPATVPAVVLETLPLVTVDGVAVAIGPWRLAPGTEGLAIRFRPRSRYADVPFGPSRPVSVASPGERLMYGNA